MNKIDKNEADSITSELTIVSGWAWYALAGLSGLLICLYCAISLLPVTEPEVSILIAICICGSLFCLWGTLFLFYRFRIDSEGVTLQRLIRRRFYSWNEIREVIISARATKSRYFITAIFCTEVHRPFVKLDIGGFHWPKWCMCVDLDSEKSPSSKLFASVDQETLLKVIEVHGIKIWYAPEALKVLHGDVKRKIR